MIAWYLDTSAILKLIVLENESLALRAFIGKENITSMYTRLEVARTLKNYSQEVHRTAGLILKTLSLVPIDASLISQAQLIIETSELKALDALHVASAIQSVALIAGIITYDKQMAAAASRLGVRVEAPH